MKLLFVLIGLSAAFAVALILLLDRGGDTIMTHRGVYEKLHEDHVKMMEWHGNVEKSAAEQRAILNNKLDILLSIATNRCDNLVIEGVR